MYRFEKYESNCNKYSDIKITINISGCYNSNKYNILKVALEDSGFIFEIKDNTLLLGISESKYVRNKYRNAGRNMKPILRKDNFLPYRYSDIIYLLNSYTDKYIYTKLKISSATYYRHKREMINSDYYKNLDSNYITDLSYLENLPNNNIF